jgi:triosephosphate isomerase
MEQIETDARMIAVVSAFDLSAVVSVAPNLEIWTQHLDPINFGSNTGWLHPETAIQRGAKGTLINHAEHKVSIEHIAMLLDSVPEGFTVCACAADIEEARALSALQPDYIAVEPPGLIGGEISVTTADPEIVSGTARAIREISEDNALASSISAAQAQTVNPSGTLSSSIAICSIDTLCSA